MLLQILSKPKYGGHKFSPPVYLIWFDFFVFTYSAWRKLYRHTTVSCLNKLYCFESGFTVQNDWWTLTMVSNLRWLHFNARLLMTTQKMRLAPRSFRTKNFFSPPNSHPNPCQIITLHKHHSVASLAFTMFRCLVEAYHIITVSQWTESRSGVWNMGRSRVWASRSCSWVHLLNLHAVCWKEPYKIIPW